MCMLASHRHPGEESNSQKQQDLLMHFTTCIVSAKLSGRTTASSDGSDMKATITHDTALGTTGFYLPPELYAGLHVRKP